MQKVANEREDIIKTTKVITDFVGRRPRGWLGPGLTETWETPDILDEEGYDYVCDWVLDDQPVSLKTRKGSIINIPYTQECNDVAMMLIQHHKASEYRDRAIDQFEQLYADARDLPASWRWWSTPTSWGRRIGCATSARRSITSPVSPVCCSAPARKSSIGIARPSGPEAGSPRSAGRALQSGGFVIIKTITYGGGSSWRLKARKFRSWVKPRRSLRPG